jgi:5'(3')-deoxyribonucleotidase
LKIILDIDDVVIDLLPRWLDMYNKEYDDCLQVQDVTDWDLTKFVVEKCGKKIYDYLKDPGLYDDIPQVDGAVAGIVVLRNMGHEIVFATATDHPGKMAWIKERFPDIPILVAPDKRWVEGDLIVDDKPDTVANFPGIGILFDRTHNQDFEWYPRAFSWIEVLTRVYGYSTKYISDVGNKVPGVGTDVPTIVNEKGGKQSRLPYRFDLIDPLTLFRLAEICHTGAVKYGEWNWRRISVEDNLNHALAHIFAHLAGDSQDDHLGHAFCRVMFALSLEITPGESDRMLP